MSSGFLITGKHGNHERIVSIYRDCRIKSHENWKKNGKLNILFLFCPSEIIDHSYRNILNICQKLERRSGLPILLNIVANNCKG